MHVVTGLRKDETLVRLLTFELDPIRI
jgi:hypothetical protein